MAIKNLKNNEFEEFIKNNDHCIVDFYADWCGPCKMLAPVMESLARQLPNMAFAKVNVDEAHKLARRFNVSSIPTVLIFKNKKLVNQFTGFRDEREIKEIINRI